MIQAVLFDVGDTLAHFTISDMAEVLLSACRSVHEDLVRQGFTPPEFEAYSRSIKRHLTLAHIRSRVIRREVQLIRVLQQCHRRFGIELNNERIADLALRCISPAVRRYLVLDPDAKDVIQSLRGSGYKLGLISNTILPGFTIDDYLNQEGLIGSLPVRVYSSDVRHMKPQRRIFRIALERLGVAAEHTLFIGDRPDNDVKGAARLGIKTILLVHDRKTPRLSVRPDEIIRRLSEVPSILQDRHI